MRGHPLRVPQLAGDDVERARNAVGGEDGSGHLVLRQPAVVEGHRHHAEVEAGVGVGAVVVGDQGPDGLDEVVDLHADRAGGRGERAGRLRPVRAGRDRRDQVVAGGAVAPGDLGVDLTGHSGPVPVADRVELARSDRERRRREVGGAVGERGDTDAERVAGAQPPGCAHTERPGVGAVAAIGPADGLAGAVELLDGVVVHQVPGRGVGGLPRLERHKAGEDDEATSAVRTTELNLALIDSPHGPIDGTAQMTIALASRGSLVHSDAPAGRRRHRTYPKFVQPRGLRGRKGNPARPQL